MAHSIELIFDDATNQRITQEWKALADAGLPSQGNIRTTSNRPHVTLVAADSLDPDVDRDLATMDGALGMEVDIGALLLFRGKRATAAHLVVPSAELLALHRCVFTFARPYIGGHLLTHIEPGAWTPHITLARRLADDQIGLVMTSLRSSPESFSARVSGLRRWDGDTREEFHLL